MKILSFGIIFTLSLFLTSVGKWAWTQEEQKEDKQNENALTATVNRMTKELNVSSEELYSGIRNVCENALKIKRPKNEDLPDELQKRLDDCIVNKLKDEEDLKKLLKREARVCDEKGNCEKKEVGIGIQKQDAIGFKTPGLKKIQKYLQDLLYKALYGETFEERKKRQLSQDPKKDSRIKGTLLDQSRFVDLFETEVGKSILTSFTTYCLDADKGGVVVPDEKEKNRKENLKRLKDADLQRAKGHFEACIAQVKYLCHKEGRIVDLEKGTIAPLKDDPVYKDYIPEIKNAACFTLRRVKQLRESLEDTAKQKKKFAKLKENTGTGFNMAESFTDPENKQGSQAKDFSTISNLSSKELMEDAGLKEEFAEQKKKFDKACGNSYQPAQSKKCKALLASVSKEDRAKLLEEFRARTNIKLAQIQSMTKDDLEEKLKEEGKSEEEIKRKLASNQSAEELKNEISDQYKRERHALIAKFKDRLDKTHLVKDKKKDNVEDIIDNVKSDIESRTQQFIENVHYHNMVVGLLVVETSDGSGTGKESRNTKTLREELEGNVYIAEKERANYKKNIEKQLEKEGIAEVEKKDASKEEDEASIAGLSLSAETLQNLIDFNDSMQSQGKSQKK